MANQTPKNPFFVTLSEQIYRVFIFTVKPSLLMSIKYVAAPSLLLVTWHQNMRDEAR